MQPLAELLKQCRDRAVEVVRKMEKTKRVVPNGFKPLEGFRVPEDYDTLVTKLLAMAEDDRINPDRMRKLAADILRNRWWTWILLHPEMPDDKVHPSRRMPRCHLNIMCVTHGSKVADSGTGTPVSHSRSRPMRHAFPAPVRREPG